MYRHYTAVRSVPRKLRALEGFSHKGESVKGGSTVINLPCICTARVTVLVCLLHVFCHYTQ